MFLFILNICLHTCIHFGTECPRPDLVKGMGNKTLDKLDLELRAEADFLNLEGGGS